MEDNGPGWRKSSYSGPNGGQCVEVGTPACAAVAVRDTTDRAGVTLAVPAATWRDFVGTLK